MTGHAGRRPASVFRLACAPRPALACVVVLTGAVLLAACQSLPVTTAPGPAAKHHHRHHHSSGGGGGGSSHGGGGGSTGGGSGALRRIHDPGTVTYSVKIASCHTRDGGLLPDRHCTPGSADPAVTQSTIGSTICRTGWTDTVRPPESQTEHAKYDVAYPAYGISDGTTSELDHLVPLELGGANDITNLWPEAGSIPNPKDEVERALNRAVCDGRVSLSAARRAVAANWETAEKRLGLS